MDCREDTTSVVRPTSRVAFGGLRQAAPRGNSPKKTPRALDGSGCPAEAPYGCFLPDLTRFGTYRHPNPSNAQGVLLSYRFLPRMYNSPNDFFASQRDKRAATNTSCRDIEKHWGYCTCSKYARMAAELTVVAAVACYCTCSKYARIAASPAARRFARAS